MRSMYLMKDDFAGYENLGLSTGTKFIDTDYFHTVKNRIVKHKYFKNYSSQPHCSILYKQYDAPDLSLLFVGHPPLQMYLCLHDLQ